MEQYFVDKYVEAEYEEGDVNLKCVMSSAERNGEVFIDLKNGWTFDSTERQRGTRDLVRTEVLRSRYAKLYRNSVNLRPNSMD